MPDMEPMLGALMKSVGLSFLFLAVAYGLLRWIRQPVERVSLIQITLLGIVVAHLMGPISGLPKFELELLPVSVDQPKSEEAVLKAVAVDRPARLPNDQMSRLAPTSSANSRESEIVSAERSGSTPPPGVEPTRPPLTATNWTGTQLRSAVVWVFASISLFHFAFVLFGYCLTKRIVAEAEELPDGVDRKVRELLESCGIRRHASVRIRVSDRAPVPMVHGLIAPTILLPRWQAKFGISSVALKHCLAHEWTHLDRRDLWTWSFVVWLQPLLWIQPFYWMLRRELRISQDQIADEFAARATGHHAEYAATLLRLAESKHPSMLGALTMAGTKSNLFRRIEMLLSSKNQLSVRCRRRVVAGFVALTAIGAISLASLQIVQAESPPAPEEKSKTESPLQEQDRDEEPSESKETTESVEHVGVVRDAETQQPIQGVSVLIRRIDSNFDRVLKTTRHTTDEKGIYRFSISPEMQRMETAGLKFRFEHQDYVSSIGVVSYAAALSDVEIEKKPFFSDVVLHPGDTVSGRIVDTQGNPIGGVEIVGFSSVADRNLMFMAHETKTKADKDGRFQIDVIHEIDSQLCVKPTEHAIKLIELRSKRGDIGDIVVDRGVPVFGQVLDARGKPVVGAWVTIEDQLANSGVRMSFEAPIRRVVRTDEKGRYRTEPMSPSTFRLAVSGEDYFLSDSQIKNESIKLPGVFLDQQFEVTLANQNQPHDIQAVPHVFVRGKVVKSNGEPAERSLLCVRGMVNGTYVIMGGEKGENEGEFVAMVPHGLRGASIMISPREVHAYKVRNDDGDLTVCSDYSIGTLNEDIDSIEFVQFDSPILKVNVVDEAGKPLPGALVGANYCNNKDSSSHLVGDLVTDVVFKPGKKDVFRSRSLCPDSEFECFAILKGYQRTSETLSVKENECRSLTLTMKKQDADEAKKD